MRHRNWNDYTLKVWNIKGQSIDMSYTMKKGYFEINKGNLNPNIYFYQISDSNGKVYSGKIVIQ